MRGNLTNHKPEDMRAKRHFPGENEEDKVKGEKKGGQRGGIAIPKDDKEYEVERIVGYCAKTKRYLVRWMGYERKQDTWEPFHFLNEAAQTEALAYKQLCKDKQEDQKCEAVSTQDNSFQDHMEPATEDSAAVSETQIEVEDSIKGGLETDSFETKCEIVWGVKPTQWRALPLGFSSTPLRSWDFDRDPDSCWDDSTVGDVAPCEFDYSVTPEFDDNHIFDDYSTRSYESQLSREKRCEQPRSDTNPKAPHDLIDQCRTVRPTKMNHPMLCLKKFEHISVPALVELETNCHLAYSQVCSLFPDKGSFDPCQKEHAIRLVERLLLLRLSPRLRKQMSRYQIRLYLRSKIAVFRGSSMFEFSTISDHMVQQQQLVADGLSVASDTERIELGEVKKYDSAISNDCRTQYKVNEIFSEIDKIYQEQCSLVELCNVDPVCRTWLNWAVARALDIVPNDEEVNSLLEERVKDWELIGVNRSCIGLEFDKLWLLHGHNACGEGCSVEFYIQTLASNFSIPHTNTVLRDLVQKRHRMWAARRHLDHETRATIVHNSTLALKHWSNLRNSCKLNNKKKEKLWRTRRIVRTRKIHVLKHAGIRIKTSQRAIREEDMDLMRARR